MTCKQLPDIRLVRSVSLDELESTGIDVRLEFFVGFKSRQLAEEKDACPFGGRGGEEVECCVVSYPTRGTEKDSVHVVRSSLVDVDEKLIRSVETWCSVLGHACARWMMLSIR